MTKPYDIAIIGGGVLGVFTAYYAKKMFPSATIVIIEQLLIGSGATQYSLGLNIPFAHSMLKRRLTKMSQQLWPELERSLNLPIKHLPLYAIAMKKNEFQAGDYFVNSIYNEVKHNEHYQQLSLTLMPKASTAYIGLPASYADAQLITKILACHYLSSASCSIIEGVKVNTIERRADVYSLSLNICPQQITARHVVLATGPWSLHLTSSLGGKTKKIVAIHINVAPKKDDPVIFFLDDDAFLLPQQDQQRWLMSLAIEEWNVQPVHSSLAIKSKDIAYAQSLLTKYAPSLCPHLAGGRVFCDYYGENRDPIIQVDKERRGCVIATGGSGSGFRLAPAIASEACQLLKELM